MRNYLLNEIIDIDRKVENVVGGKQEKLTISLEFLSNGDVSLITDGQIIAAIRDRINELNPSAI